MEPQADRDGCLTLSLEVADTPELVGWILSFGAGVRVVLVTLRRQVLAAAAKIVDQGDPSRHKPARLLRPMDTDSQRPFLQHARFRQNPIKRQERIRRHL
jgi:hypothetical protein